MEATGEQSASADKSFGVDIEMSGQEAAGPVVSAGAEDAGEHENGGEGGGGGEGEGEGEGGSGELMAPAEEQPEEPRRLTYVDYFKSPIVALQIGQDEPTTLTAHQALLEYSPFFAEACAHQTSDRPQVIELPEEDLDAVGCFLEFLYTGEYFPQKEGSRKLVDDPTLPDVDQEGDQLLKHARVYTLAQKFGVDELKTLAHSKVHCVNSSAMGEIAYARYVYATTMQEDESIRKPIASFWAHRSHVLRSEAEEEFKSMCLEFPQFSFDVITRLLDEKAKNERPEKTQRAIGTPAASSSRKRQRHSQLG